MSNRKIALHESEKSPQMLMHHWTLNLMLDKDKKRLGRSEKMVCNRITVEQKLLCKSYRKKLHESKIKFARITQNKEMEKELIEEKTFNTDVGNEIEKDEMLKKIWRAGSQKFLDNRRKQEILKSRLLIKMGSTDSLESTSVRTVKTAQGTRRPATAVSIASPSFVKRPFTAIESHVRLYKPDGQLSTKDEEEPDAVEDNADTRDDTASPAQGESHITPSTRPKTASIKRQPAVIVSARPKSVGIKSTTNQNKAQNGVETPPIGSCFLERKKPTLLDIHKVKLREAKYEDKIKQFGVSISDMCDTTQSMNDYYTICLRKDSEEQCAQKVVSFAHLAGAAVPPEEFKRWSGNTELKAITVKKLDYDFHRYPSSYFHPSVY